KVRGPDYYRPALRDKNEGNSKASGIEKVCAPKKRKAFFAVAASTRLDAGGARVIPLDLNGLSGYGMSGLVNAIVSSKISIFKFQLGLDTSEGGDLSLCLQLRIWVLAINGNLTFPALENS
ncbi:unnamed protein product, partial [Discosporangium mesarthrocarpum]